MGKLLCIALGAAAAVQAQEVSLGGKVSQSGGVPVAGVSIRIAGKPQVSALSNANGEFSLGTASLRPFALPAGHALRFEGHVCVLSLSRPVADGSAEFLAWNGKTLASFPLRDLRAGPHSFPLPSLRSGVFFLRLRLEGTASLHRLLGVDDQILETEAVGMDPARSRPAAPLKAAAAVDTLLAAKDGYATAKIPLASFSQKDLRIHLDPVCAIPALPALAALPAIATLPDPFKSMAGSRIAGKAEWACRREEIAKQLQVYELGEEPPRPATLTGAFKDSVLTITAGQGGKSISFSVTIRKPSTGTAPYPALLAIGGSSISEVSSLGIATIAFPNNDIAAQSGASSRGQGKFYTLYGSDHPAGAMMAWAWAISRIIDVLEATPEAGIDPKRIAVTGCSRNGKGALVAGAFDERIALTIPQESGSGGAGSWRVSDYMFTTLKQNTQTLSEIIGENVWFGRAFDAFSGKTNQLPFDHHMLMGMVAPRGLLLIDNDVLWLGPSSSYSDANAGQRVYQALGVPEAFTYSLQGGHAHCSFPTSQKHWVDAYAAKYLLGGAGEAAKIESTPSQTFDGTRWIDWTTPNLR